MRYQYFIHFLTFAVLFLIDFVIQSFFNLGSFERVMFVSQLHFLALVFYAKEDSRTDITVKVLLVAFFLDLLQLKSFPVYYFSYGLSLIVIRVWYRHIDDSYMEIVLISGLALFIKEVLLYVSLLATSNTGYSLMSFIEIRSLWVILFNLMLLPIPYLLVKKSNKLVKSYSRRHYQ